MACVGENYFIEIIRMYSNGIYPLNVYSLEGKTSNLGAAKFLILGAPGWLS